MCLWQTYMMTHGTPTATKRKSDSQYPRHGDARNKSRLFYVPLYWMLVPASSMVTVNVGFA